MWPSRVDVTSESGSAMLIVVMAVVLMSGVGAGLVLGSSIEGMVAANYRVAAQAVYAADAACQRAVGDLSMLPDWDGVARGSLRSLFVDGGPMGARLLSDSSTIDLGAVVRRAASDSGADWKPYAYGAIRDLVPGRRIESPFYVLVLIANAPMRPGGPLPGPGDETLFLRAIAFGPRGAERTVELTLARKAHDMRGRGR